MQRKQPWGRTLKQLAKKIDEDLITGVILVGMILGIIVLATINIGEPLMGGIMIGGALYLIGFGWGAKVVYKAGDFPGRSYSTFYEVKDGLMPAFVGGLVWPLVLVVVLLTKLAKWGYFRVVVWHKSRTSA